MLDPQRFEKLARQMLDLVGADGKPGACLREPVELFAHARPEPRVVCDMGAVMGDEFVEQPVE